MRGGERVTDLNGEIESLLQRDRAFTQAVGKSFAFEVLHDQVGSAVVLADVVEVTDVRMVEGGDGAGFAFEAGGEFGVGREVCGKNLDGDDAIEASVAGAVNLSHSASAEGGLNFVWTEFGAGGERHVVRAIIASAAPDATIGCLNG